MLPDAQQRILPEVPPYHMPVLDLQGQARPQAELAAVRERMRGQKAAFDRWPLFDFLAHLLDDHQIQLHIRLDALLMDGTSRLMLIQELFQLLADPDLALPALECSYRDYAVAWAAFQESDHYRRARAYHLGRLPTLPPAPALPLAQPITPATPSRFTTRLERLLAPEAWTRLKADAARAGLTPSAVVIAAFVEVLAAWSRQPHFTFSLVGSYRPPIHPQIGDILGNFNTFHLVAVEDRSGSFEERARRLHRQITNDLEHISFAGPQILRELNRLRRSGPRATMPILFNSVIEYQHPRYQRLKSRGGAATETLGIYRELEVGVYFPQVLLMPSVMETAEGSLECKWDAVEDVFPNGLMQDMLHAYQHLLRRLADDPASWQTATPLLAQAPRNPDAGRGDRPGAATTTQPPCGEELSQSLPEPSIALIGPCDELEHQLARLWEELLAVRPIGITDDFFQRGGTSFLLVRLLARLQESFGQDIGVSSFLQEPTIQNLAHIVRRNSVIAPPLPLEER